MYLFKVKKYISLLLAASIVLSGYKKVPIFHNIEPNSKSRQPLPLKIQKALKDKSISLYAPLLIRIFKEEKILQIWKEGIDKRFHYITSYKVCKISGKLGPKYHFADMQAPEGFYFIHAYQLNPHSHYYLSFNVGYPNIYDKAHHRSGSGIMVHGGCKSSGCYAMGDKNMGEIYGFVRDALKGGQKSIPLEIYPFRMTNKNMLRYKDDYNYQFWQDLKIGYDIFNKTHCAPKVYLKNKKYIFAQNSCSNLDLNDPNVKQELDQEEEQFVNFWDFLPGIKKVKPTIQGPKDAERIAKEVLKNL